MARPELGPVLLSLALLSACAPAAGKDAPTAPISPASAPAGKTGGCEPNEYAAAIGVPTPVTADTPLSPRMKEINYRVLACLDLSEPEKAAFRQEMVLRSVGLAATPQAREQGQGGGLIPTPLPSATPRPDLTPVVVIMPDGTKVLVPLPAAMPTPMTMEEARRLFDPKSLPSESSFPMPELMSRQQMPGEINKLITSVKAIDKHLDPDVSLERLNRDLKPNFEEYMKSAQALIAKGDMEGANQALLKAKRVVDALGYGPKEVRIPPDVKKKEDPLAILLGSSESVDPRIEEIYWRTVRLLRSTNKDYFTHPYYQNR